MQTESQKPFSGRGTLPQVVTELRRQQAERVDFVADTRDVKVIPHEGTLALAAATPSGGEWLPDPLPLTNTALPQLGERQGVPVPAKFLRAAAMAHPSRIADYLTEVMREDHKRRLVRTLDGRVRAYLSDRYKAIDSLDAVTAALAGASEVGVQACHVLDASVSETHVRVKLVNTACVEVAAELPENTFARWGGRAATGYRAAVGLGPVMEPGAEPFDGGVTGSRDLQLHPIVEISNSDTGHGGMTASLGILQALCLNTATTSQTLREVHLGGRLDAGVYSYEAIQAEAQAITLKARDVVRAGFAPAVFAQLVESIRPTMHQQIAAPQAACRSLLPDLPGLDLDDLMGAFYGEQAYTGPTTYSLGQAVARLAQDTDEPGVAADREVMAGQLLTGSRRVPAEVLA